LPDYGSFGGRGVRRDAVSLSRAWQYSSSQLVAYCTSGLCRWAELG